MIEFFAVAKLKTWICILIHNITAQHEIHMLHESMEPEMYIENTPILIIWNPIQYD